MGEHWQADPLAVFNPRRTCGECGGGWRRRRRCAACHESGFAAIDLAGAWAPRPGFLVCGGPSLKSFPVEELRGRGVVSLGVNNAAAFAPCTAFVFGDPQWKFHSALFYDPKVLVFAPKDKLRKHPRVRLDDGSYRIAEHTLAECPGVYGIARSGRLVAAEFLTTFYAHWGHGGKGEEPQPFRRLATMLVGLRLLAYLGCPVIYLLGVDFDTGAGGYAWGDSASCGGTTWAKIDAMLNSVRGVFEAAGISIRNCNPFSKCEAFPFASFSEALVGCRGPVQRDPLRLDGYYSRGVLKANQEIYPDLLSRDALRGWPPSGVAAQLRGDER